jgi:DNA mismatch repair protein MutS2
MEEMPLLPIIPAPLTEISAAALEWVRLRDLVAGHSSSPVGRAWVNSLTPTSDAAWLNTQHSRTDEVRRLITAQLSFDFHPLFDATQLLDKSRIDGATLEASEIRNIVGIVECVVAWRSLMASAQQDATSPALQELSAPLFLSSQHTEQQTDLAALVRALQGRIEPDGSLNDSASPELRRLRREMERQQRQIEDVLRASLRKLSSDGSTQDALITVRGERFVIPIKAEHRRRVAGVVHGASSSGQTFFVEPLDVIDENNELVRLLDEEQAEIHRILTQMTREIGRHAVLLTAALQILAEVESHFARARFAIGYNAVRPEFSDATISLSQARHPLLEMRLRTAGNQEKLVPLDLSFSTNPDETPTESPRQLIISGPNTGGKTVTLKTLGLLALMAQSGIPLPAERATLPLFTAIYADIGDAQSIEQSLSTFSAHISNINRITAAADPGSLVLLDELGSATDPDEGAALAVSVAEHFLLARAWCVITTHLTALKVYASNHAGVINAAAGFDEHSLAPTYRLRIGVPGASAGINIAERLGLNPAIIRSSRSRLQSQTADISRFIDQLHTQLAAASQERAALRLREQEVAREKNRLEHEGRNEQRVRVRELESKLQSLLKDFEYQIRETVRAIEDRAAAQKLSKEAERRLARLRREFSEQFNSTVVAHHTGADTNDTHAQPHVVRHVSAGDTVKLKTLGRNATVLRALDGNAWEVSVGAMKMRVAKDEIAEVVSSVNAAAVSPLNAIRSRKNISVSLGTSRSDIDDDSPAMAMEINVIGQTADEAQDSVEKFLDRAFLSGLARVRIVHGTGMGILRRTLRTYLKQHPQVSTVTEPPHNEGGAGATLVELKQ